MLDTSTLIAYLEGGRQSSALAAILVDGYIRAGRNSGVVSAVTVMELLVEPIRHRRTEALRIVQDFVSEFPNVRVAPVDVEVATQAAHVRAYARLDPADALIVATGLNAGARAFVTSDREWSRLATLEDAPRVIDLG